jgi:hypothetical protein
LNKSNTNHAIFLSLVSAAFVLSSCDEQPADYADVQPVPASWTQITTDQLDQDSETQLAKALVARNEMESQLKDSLMAAIQADGPHGAVVVCSTIAPAIASDLSTKHGLEIGRTSFKIRNSSNTPPEWMTPIVDERDPDSAYFVGTDGSFAVSYPITIAPPCLTCHGNQDSLSNQVKESIQTHYPDDQATGFALGDLRGWFWVEVPASD